MDCGYALALVSESRQKSPDPRRYMVLVRIRDIHMARFIDTGSEPMFVHGQF